MTTKAAFTPQEWELVLAGPVSAGMIVVTAARGGMIRETLALSKVYVEARRLHGQNELLDEIVAAKPGADHTKYHSRDELRAHGLQTLREAMTVLRDKATTDEVEGYRAFVRTLSDRVAAAHREDGRSVSPAEADAIAQITAALADPGPES